MTVVEFSPGGGWYTEVLAPALRDSGKLYAAHYDMNAGAYERRSLGGFLRKLGERPDVYDQVTVTTITEPGGEPIAPSGPPGGRAHRRRDVGAPSGRGRAG